VEIGFAGGMFLCGVLFLAASARRRRRRRKGITFPDLFFAPVASSSGVSGEVWETCLGVRGRYVLASGGSGCYWLLSSRLQSWLWVLWLLGGWIWLGFASATVVVDGGVRSRSWRSWGVAPVDG